MDHVFKLKNAEKASVIVMDVKNGDILAMASRPDYDPNNYASFHQDTWRNSAISMHMNQDQLLKLLLLQLP